MTGLVRYVSLMTFHKKSGQITNVINSYSSMSSEHSKPAVHGSRYGVRILLSTFKKLSSNCDVLISNPSGHAKSSTNSRCGPTNRPKSCPFLVLIPRFYSHCLKMPIQLCVPHTLSFSPRALSTHVRGTCSPESRIGRSLIDFWNSLIQD